jgi:hypothetical protein
MIANAPSKTTCVDYSLTSTQNGWKLTAWEPAAVTVQRRRPFLWKFEVELPTLGEAHTTLRIILGEGD